MIRRLAKYGLYTSFISCFVYAVLGTRKEVTIGPTVVGAVLMAPYVSEFGASIAILISFYSGIIIILGAIFNLGQLPALLGIRAGGVTFLTALIAVFDNIEQTRLWDARRRFRAGHATEVCDECQEQRVVRMAVGLQKVVACAASSRGRSEIQFPHGVEIRIAAISAKFKTRFVLQILQLYAEKYEANSPRQKAFRIFMRYLALSRNAIIVVLSTIIIANVTQPGEDPPVYVTGKIEEGMPGFDPPEFVISRGNETLSVPQATRALAPSILVPIIMVLEAITTLHAFTKGKNVDMRQEIFIIGLCNFINSFFSGFYISGSITRSAINNSSGVRTPFGGIVTGTLVILVLSFLTSSLYYLPNAALASVVVVAIAFIVQIHNETLRYWKNGNRATYSWKDRSDKKGGGVLLATKHDLYPKRMYELENNSELIWCEFDAYRRELWSERTCNNN
ncbi:hypothetical protein B566_EDAN007884 [Ephemera danica]|nr:hypothetical protein B566_EDAN007884 [Ephemera danica]